MQNYFVILERVNIQCPLNYNAKTQSFRKVEVNSEEFLAKNQKKRQNLDFCLQFNFRLCSIKAYKMSFFEGQQQTQIILKIFDTYEPLLKKKRILVSSTGGIQSPRVKKIHVLVEKLLKYQA